MGEPTSLQDRTAIVVGAGSGVGRAVSLALAAQGCRLVLVGRRTDPLEETATQARRAGVVALVSPGDAREEATAEETVRRGTGQFGGIDALVYCAGIGVYGPTISYRLDDWRATIETNLTGAFLFSRAVLPLMVDAGRGDIVAISSGAGKQGYATLAAYSASKFGLMGLMQSLAAEYGERGVRVGTVVPGSVLTGFGGRPEEEKQEQRQDGRKYLDVEDVARAVLQMLTAPRTGWVQELQLWPF